jgi:bacterioferritin
MKGDPQVIHHLNTILKNELTAISQYFLHSRLLRDWGVDELAEKAYAESIDEMKHADKLIERVIFLEGLPGLQELNRLRIGENVRETLESDLALEHDGIKDLREAIVHCETVRDFVSRDLFREILSDEEEHVDWLETQFSLIDQIGIERYIQLKSK